MNVNAYPIDNNHGISSKIGYPTGVFLKNVYNPINTPEGFK